MILTIDTDSKILRVTEGEGVAHEYPLFTPQSFGILSRQWLALGWNLGHWSTFSWMGRQVLQLPDDLLRLGEMLWRVRPDVIIETGVYDGGSALWFRNFCRVIGVDRELRPGVRETIGSRVTLIEGDSASPETTVRVARGVRSGERVCVFLDSDHSTDHVAAELRGFAPFVSSGCYLIVADSILPDLAATPSGEIEWLNSHPRIAVEAFMSSNQDFQRRRPVPLFGAPFDFCDLSYFPDTWLKRR
jgi:cephalosporin hydroxylase